MTEFTSADGVLRSRDMKAKRYLHFYPDSIRFRRSCSAATSKCCAMRP